MRMDSRLTKLLMTILALGVMLLTQPATAQEISPDAPLSHAGQSGAAATPTVPTVPTGATLEPTAPSSPLNPSMSLPDFNNRKTFSSAMQMIILLTVLSLAPAILIMMTSFTRIIIVLSLLRQALGTQQLPPNQVLMGLALFMTFLVMGPTFSEVNRVAITPYLHGDITDQQVALDLAVQPMRAFMEAQIDRYGNDDDVLLFTDLSKQPVPKNWGEVHTMSLIPAFMLSELKVAFSIGFRIYLPFLIIDMVVSSILTSMGMMMLPPALISLPFKILLFVLVNGWALITGSLMGSFVT